MKILFINKIYSPDIGGVETVVKQYAEHIASSTNEAIVLCISKKFASKTKIETINNVKVIRCASLGTFLSMPISLSFIFWFIRLVRRTDLIHFHEPFPIGSLLGCLPFFKTKIIVTWHSDIIKQKYIRKIVEFFQKRLLKKADCITTTSENLKSSSRLLPAFKNKIKVIPLAVNIDELNSAINLSPTTINSKILGKYALFIGRLSYYKGVEFLLNALKTIPNINTEEKITLVIAGEGDSKIRNKILNFVNNEYVHLLFIDRFISEEEKQILLQNAYIYLFPSVYPSEAFGIAQLEALACGVPVINTYLETGVPWVSLHEVTGITVQPFDNIELASAIIKLFKNEEWHKELSVNARDRAQKLFSHDMALTSIQNTYEKVLQLSHHS